MKALSEDHRQVRASGGPIGTDQPGRKSPSPSPTPDRVSSMAPSPSDQGEVAATGGPAAALRPDAIKAIPVRHWGRWISAGVVTYLLVALIVSFVKNPTCSGTSSAVPLQPITMRGLLLTARAHVSSPCSSRCGRRDASRSCAVGQPGALVIAWVYIWFSAAHPCTCRSSSGPIWGPCTTRSTWGCRSRARVGSAQSSRVIVNFLWPRSLALGLNEAAYAASSSAPHHLGGAGRARLRSRWHVSGTHDAGASCCHRRWR